MRNLTIKLFKWFFNRGLNGEGKPEGLVTFHQKR